MNNTTLILLGIIIGLCIIFSVIIYSESLTINALEEHLLEKTIHHEELERAIDILNILHTQIENEKLDELIVCQELLNQCK